ncbi:hypothetical protein EXU57_12135 [Segetibacter sp. 3557_3]|uniref:outer membrane beta-barrel protein n=1 Tax=Segetibacter sp. 3557_3 TaxID=2547429 RepID=UPI001058F5A2|nr:outer membrane beta-barrel protein [Segetibacter sp. 3557_3]TDH26230.1 hypothetical protein EXU57_12135 [Segetibacter sp. 3557_3]
MTRMTMLSAALLVAMAGLAQKDTTTTTGSDTIRIGGMIIIKKKGSGDNGTNQNKTVTIQRKSKKPSNVSTNYGILDIGFANVRDETVYGSAEANGYLRTTRPGEPDFTSDDLKLKTGKTSNINFWLFMQRLNITKGVLNLKYGLGVEMFNFRYENNISYHRNPSYIFRDSIAFSKNKLYVGYASVPFMLNVNTRPGKKGGLSFSAGVTAGYLIGSRNKQISGERGKDKLKGDFDLEKFRLAYIGELGLGPVRLFGSYSTTALHEKGLKQYPYSFGIRLSNW